MGDGGCCLYCFIREACMVLSEQVAFFPRMTTVRRYKGGGRLCKRYQCPSDPNASQLGSDKGLISPPLEKKITAGLGTALRGRRSFPFPLGRFRSPAGNSTQANVCTSSSHNDFSYSKITDHYIPDPEATILIQTSVIKY